MIRARDYPLPTVNLACTKCGRRGRYSKARFCEIVGPDTSLPEARHIIAADCDRMRAAVLTDRCGINYPDLARVLSDGPAR